jgi:hypothetical protein
VKSRLPVRRKVTAEDGKLTAHSCSAQAIKRLEALAAAEGVSRAEAAKGVFERELRERWLAKAAGLTVEQRSR